MAHFSKELRAQVCVCVYLFIYIHILEFGGVKHGVEGVNPGNSGGKTGREPLSLHAASLSLPLSLSLTHSHTHTPPLSRSLSDERAMAARDRM